jgi:RNA-directed DNA polymerase
MSTKLDRIAEIAKERPKEKFTTLMHLINEIMYFGRNSYRDFKNGKGPKPPTFYFLGFTHYCSNSQNGNFRVKRKTSAKKFRNSLKRCNQWLKENRALPIDELMKSLSVKLNGYFRYYGITDNYESVNTYRDKVRYLLFKWLNRRSQKRSFNWDKFLHFMKQYRLPKTKIYVNIFESKKEISYIR